MEYPTETRRTGFGDGNKPVFFPNPQFGVFIGIEEFVDSLAVDRETDMAAFTGDEDALRSISIHDYYRHILADVRSCLEGTYEDSRIEIKVFSCLPWSSFDALFVPDDPCVPDYPLSEKRDGLDHDNAREIIIETLVREMEEMKPKEERIPIVDERGLFLYSP